jgi:hypothetical protein
MNHERSLEISSRLGDTKGQMRSYANLGNAYGCLGDFHKAVYYHEQQLRAAVALGDKVRVKYYHLQVIYHLI